MSSNREAPPRPCRPMVWEPGVSGSGLAWLLLPGVRDQHGLACEGSGSNLCLFALSSSCSSSEEEQIRSERDNLMYYARDLTRSYCYANMQCMNIFSKLFSRLHEAQDELTPHLLVPASEGGRFWLAVWIDGSRRAVCNHEGEASR